MLQGSSGNLPQFYGFVVDGGLQKWHKSVKINKDIILF